MLVDECSIDGLAGWRGSGNSSEFVIVLGCLQDIQAVWMKNGMKNYQTQNFTVSVSTHPKGPWKQVLNDSLPLYASKVCNTHLCIFEN